MYKLNKESQHICFNFSPQKQYICMCDKYTHRIPERIMKMRLLRKLEIMHWLFATWIYSIIQSAKGSNGLILCSWNLDFNCLSCPDRKAGRRREPFMRRRDFVHESKPRCFDYHVTGNFICNDVNCVCIDTHFQLKGCSWYVFSRERSSQDRAYLKGIVWLHEYFRLIAVDNLISTPIKHCFRNGSLGELRLDFLG